MTLPAGGCVLDVCPVGNGPRAALPLSGSSLLTRPVPSAGSGHRVSCVPLRLGSVPVNSACRPGWATVPRCLVRYSRRFWAICWMRLTLKSVAFESSRSASSGWVGLIRLVEGLRGERLTPKAGGIGLGWRPLPGSHACSGWTCWPPRSGGPGPGGVSAPPSPPPPLSPLLVCFLGDPGPCCVLADFVKEEKK